MIGAEARATASVLQPTAALRPFVAWLRANASLLLWCAVGVELLAVWSMLPATLDVLRDPAATGYGDFDHLYDNARALNGNGLNSPAVSAMLYPLTFLGIATAFRVFVLLNAAALIGIAYIAQRPLASPAGKIAAALAPLALPQAHWALRTGHFSALLALAALGGLLLAQRRPYVAGALIALLVCKPQYLPVPLLYLAVSRNWRALGAATTVLGAVSVAGIAAVALHGGLGDLLGLYERYARALWQDAGGQGVILQPAQESWQYSWQGFLISTGGGPNVAAAFALMALSGAAVLAAWLRAPGPAAQAAAVAGMLLLAPYSTFYNWCILAAAFALLLRADLRPRALVPAICVTVGLAAAATQAATPFPILADRYTEASTRGVYWLQPAVLASVITVAVAGSPARAREAKRTMSDVGARLSWRALVPAAAGFAVAAFVVAAWVSHEGPFARGDRYFNSARVAAALPDDFPAPAAKQQDVGRGTSFPYRVEWRSDDRVNDVAGAMQTRLSGERWRIIDEQRDGGSLSMRIAGTSAEGAATLIGVLRFSPDAHGSDVALEFAPLPVSAIPGYDEWLAGNGLSVRDVRPEDLR